MFTDSSAPGKAYSVYVDDTMTRLIIEVKVERSSPVIMLAKPSGKYTYYKLHVLHSHEKKITVVLVCFTYFENQSTTFNILVYYIYNT
jgi:hypothetical protein